MAMNVLAELIEQNPGVAETTFRTVDDALNQVLPGSNVHARYEDAEEVGLAVIVGKMTQVSFNPFDGYRGQKPTFIADNQDTHPGAWEAIPSDSEFLEGREAPIGRFIFFALAKTENMRITGRVSSYNPDKLAISPGRVGFAGGRLLMDSFVTPSGLWEVHDHLVSGVFATEVAEVATETREPRTSDDLAELFEREFARINTLHEGVAAADLSHADVGKLLPLVDDLIYHAA